MYKKTIDLKNEPAALNQDIGLLKTSKDQQRPAVTQKEAVLTPDDAKSSQSESKYRRVAKFLILIGSERAAEILAELDPEQVEKISKEIAFIKVIKPEERDEILAEFHSLFARLAGQPYSFTGSSHGGIEAARRILYAAKGPEKGEEILNRAVPDSKENLFSFLEDFSADQLIILLKEETAQTIALILSRLPPKISAETISKLPPDRKPEVLKRIAYQREISPEVLEQIAAALKEKARHIGGSSKDIAIDGMKALADILKQGDYAFGDKIISELEQTSPDIGKDLKDKLYSLEDVIISIDRPIQEKLSTMSEQDIAVLIKGRSREFREKILSCVSAGRRALIREESEILGAIPKRDCDAAAGEFLEWFRTAREKGEIILNTDKDVFL